MYLRNCFSCGRLVNIPNQFWTTDVVVSGCQVLRGLVVGAKRVAAVVTCRPSCQSLWVCYFLNLGHDYDLLSDFLGPSLSDPKPEPSSMYVIMLSICTYSNIMWAAKPFQQFPAEPFWKPPPIFRVAIRQQCRVQLTFWQTGCKGICCT